MALGGACLLAATALPYVLAGQTDILIRSTLFAPAAYVVERGQNSLLRVFADMANDLEGSDARIRRRFYRLSRLRRHACARRKSLARRDHVLRSAFGNFTGSGGHVLLAHAGAVCLHIRDTALFPPARGAPARISAGGTGAGLAAANSSGGPCRIQSRHFTRHDGRDFELFFRSECGRRTRFT